MPAPGTRASTVSALASLDCVRQLLFHCFGPFPWRIFKLYTTPHAPCGMLYWVSMLIICRLVLIGACNPMLFPIHVCLQVGPLPTISKRKQKSSNRSTLGIVSNLFFNRSTLGIVSNLFFFPIAPSNQTRTGDNPEWYSHQRPNPAECGEREWFFGGLCLVFEKKKPPPPGGGCFQWSSSYHRGVGWCRRTKMPPDSLEPRGGEPA